MTQDLIKAPPTGPAGTRPEPTGYRLPARVLDAVCTISGSTGAAPWAVLVAALAIVLGRHTGADELWVDTGTGPHRLRTDRPATGRQLVDRVGALVRPQRADIVRVSPAGPGSQRRALSVTVRGELLSVSDAGDNAGDDAEPPAACATLLGGSLLDVVTALAAGPDIPLTGFDLALPTELSTIAQWNSTWCDIPDRAAPVLLEEQVRRTPDAAAVEFGASSWTYGELNGYANRVAEQLRQLGAGPESIVGMCLAPGPHAVACVWGVWKAGAALLPIDPNWPTGRLRSVTAETSPVVVLTDADTAAAASRTPCPTMPCGHLFDPAPTAAERRGRTTEPPGLETAAYLIYTSGSTGRPKGVVIEHRGLVNHAYGRLLPMYGEASAGHTEQLRVGVSAAMVFDVFLNQLVPLLAGHTVVVPDRDQATAGNPFGHFIRLATGSRGLDAIDCATAQASLLLDFGLFDAPHPPRLLIVGGESCPPALWATLTAQAPRGGRPGTIAYNVYGASECAIDSTATAVTETGCPTIGRPDGNTAIHVLDQGLQPLPVGAVGEICIGGAGVGRGYIARPGLTADAFRPDPFASRPGARLYRTGDLGRWRADGYLEFCGRRDHQLKILGQRVELEEVEVLLQALPGVRSVAVVPVHGAYGTRLAAYLTLAPRAGFDREQTVARLSEMVPAHMIPSCFTVLDALPTNTNGKVDRARLHELASRV